MSSTEPAVSAAVTVTSCTPFSFPTTACASTSFASSAACAASARMSVPSSVMAAASSLTSLASSFFVPCLASLPFAFVFAAAGFFSAAAAAADASVSSAALSAASLASETALFTSCADAFASCAWLLCRTSSKPEDFAVFETDVLFTLTFDVPACGLVLIICTLFMLSPPFYEIYRRFSDFLK